MKIYEQELADGIGEIIQASASVSYASIVEPSNASSKNRVKHIKSLASVNDGDLYYVQSILVTSSWNKNDDIFDKAEVWAARNTPEDKPTNLEHDESVIMGHITSNWPITTDGILIDEDTPLENLPDKFHILTGSVIYKAYSAPELLERASRLIAEIEEGNKYVSMECLFGNFDYGILNEGTGEYKVLARNENTAYLSKYLRAYGGTGKHDNYKIGRLLRNITFSGKGFVDKPANPDSVIFTKNMVAQSSEKILSEKIEDLGNTGVSNKQSNLNVENFTMSSDNTAAQVETSEATTTEEISTQAPVTSETVVADAVVDNASELESLKQEKEALAKSYEDTIKTQAEENEQIKKELAEMKTVIEGYVAKEAEMARKEIFAKRLASLVDLGIDTETATAAVEKFESLDDEAFATIASLFAQSAKKKEKKEEDKEEATQNEVAAKVEEETKEEEENEDEKKESPKNAELGKKTKSSVDAEVLDTAEVEDSVNLSVGGQVESAVESTRAALVEFISNRLGKKL